MAKETHTTTIDAETLKRVLAVCPIIYTPAQVERDAKLNERRTFRLLK